MDTPGRDLDEAEYVGELRSKRLGLSETVNAQIRRYSDCVRQKQRLEIGDVSAIARLIGRRPDAEQVFRGGGEYLAKRIYDDIPAITRWVAGSLPATVSRPVALRAMQRLAVRYYNGSIERVGSFVTLAVPESATAGTATREVGCTFYEASFAAILQRLASDVGRIEHIHCVTRGDEVCQWRADWRHSR